MEWFGDTVVWLNPSPSEPFRQLTLALWDEFPETPPYEGRFGREVRPHLTVGDGAPPMRSTC